MFSKLTLTANQWTQVPGSDTPSKLILRSANTIIAIQTGLTTPVDVGNAAFSAIPIWEHGMISLEKTIGDFVWARPSGVGELAELHYEGSAAVTGFGFSSGFSNGFG